jgi:hypothetical protein
VNVEHERARAINDRWPAAQLPQPWHGYGLLGQIVFFVLTVAGIFAFSMLTKNELLTTVVCLALAEFLIRGRRWFGTGVEAALWIGGLLSAVMALPNTGAPEGNLLIAAAAAIAGFRVRNPVFGAFAAYFVTRYFEVKYDLGNVAALLLAAIALVALHKTWKRPSTEWLFIALLVTMPFAGWDHAGPEWANLSLALYAALMIIAFASAVRQRHHGMFAGAAAAAIVTAGMLHERLKFSEELLFAVAGAILLVASLLTARLLRGRTHGFVVTRAALTPFDDDLEGLATVAVAPAHSAGNPPEGRPQDGGGFGGAGATGDY